MRGLFEALGLPALEEARNPIDHRFVQLRE
jgi:hypothetical protein